jgi:hypothetical protein
MSPGPASAERRYRRLLRIHPSWYRERYEDEMVEVYLAGQPEARPRAGEVAATARLAVVARLRQVGRAGAATWWLLAIAATTAMAASVVVRTGLTIRSRLSDSGGWVLGPDGRLARPAPSVPDWQLLDLHGLLWLAALGLLLLGTRRTALVVASVTAVLDVSRGLGPLVSRDSAFLEVALARADLQAALLPLVAVGAIVLSGRAPGERPRAGSRVVSAGISGVLLALGWTLFRLGWPVAWAGQSAAWPVTVLAVAGAAAAVLVAHRWLPPAWPATVMASAALVTVAGVLPAGPVFVGTSGALRSYEPVTAEGLPGLLIGIVALLVAGLAWVAASDRYPPRPRVRRGTDRELASG